MTFLILTSPSLWPTNKRLHIKGRRILTIRTGGGGGRDEEEGVSLQIILLCPPSTPLAILPFLCSFLLLSLTSPSLLFLIPPSLLSLSPPSLLCKYPSPSTSVLLTHSLPSDNKHCIDEPHFLVYHKHDGGNRHQVLSVCLERLPLPSPTPLP